MKLSGSPGSGTEFMLLDSRVLADALLFSENALGVFGRFCFEQSVRIYIFVSGFLILLQEKRNFSLVGLY